MFLVFLAAGFAPLAFGLSLSATMPRPAAVTVPAVAPVSGDFDGDGLADRAYVRKVGAAHELVVERGAGRTSLVQEVGNPATLYLAVLAPGTYRTACAKGFGPSDAPCPERAVTLDRPALEFGAQEASQAVALWDGRRFRVVWLSD